MRLGAYGFDQQAINTEVYVQAREIFVLFEGLLNAAQARRLLLIREMKRHRFLGSTSGSEYSVDMKDGGYHINPIIPDLTYQRTPPSRRFLPPNSLKWLGGLVAGTWAR